MEINWWHGIFCVPVGGGEEKVEEKSAESASPVECLAKYFMRSMGSSRIYASRCESAPPSWKKPQGFSNRRLFTLLFIHT